MALTDNTTHSRTILGGVGPVQVTLTGTVYAGDLVAGSGVQADGNAGLPAKFIAGMPGVSGDVITCYKAARVGGVTGGTLGNRIYLSDTAGGYSETASTTSRQVVGIMLSATEMWIAPEDFENKFYVQHSFAAAGVANIIFIATQRCTVTAVKEVHATAAGQAGTLTLERLQGTEAPAAGDDLLSANFDLTGTINTVQTGTLTATTAYLTLEVGNRLCLKLASGAANSLANACITVELERA